MKKFLVRCSLFGAVLLGSMFLLLNLGDGYTDAFYVRFTTPRQHSLILGGSRSAQGIQPSVLDSVLGRDDVFNFSFTVMDSPYGPVYERTVRQKLDMQTSGGIFVLSVAPWTISTIGESPNDTSTFRELGGCLAEIEDVNLDPNIQYLVDAFDKHYINLLTENDQMFLHDDGWLELTVNMDEASIERRTLQKIADHQGMKQKYRLSGVRVKSLCRIVRLLREHGRVYLVRLPVDPRIREVEDSFMPNLEEVLHEAIAESNGYLDMSDSGSRFTYVDGSHLYKGSADDVTRRIGEWIRETENREPEIIPVNNATL